MIRICLKYFGNVYTYLLRKEIRYLLFNVEMITRELLLFEIMFDHSPRQLFSYFMKWELLRSC
ncbi:hypothetical protein D3C78_1987330 [compost metagenome]